MQRVQICLSLVVSMLFAATLTGQTDNKNKKQSTRSSTLVDVHLINGEKVRGVVKDGRYVELPQGVAFRDGKREERGAGIRLWHVKGTHSYIFIPYVQVRSYRVVRTLTDLEVREIAEQSRKAALERAKAAKDEAKKRADLRKKREQEKALLEKLNQLAADEEAQKAQDDAARKHLELLSKFRPDQKWGPDRLIEIRKRVAIDLFPTPEEKSFVESYETWKAAFDYWNKEGKARFETLDQAFKWLVAPAPKKTTVPKGKGDGDDASKKPSSKKGSVPVGKSGN